MSSSTTLRGALGAAALTGLALGFTPMASATTTVPQTAEITKTCEQVDGVNTGFTNVVFILNNEKGTEEVDFVINEAYNGEAGDDSQPFPVPAGEWRDMRADYSQANANVVTLVVYVGETPLASLEFETADCAPVVPPPPPVKCPDDTVWTDLNGDGKVDLGTECAAVTPPPPPVEEPPADDDNGTDDGTDVTDDGQAPAPNTGSNPPPAQGTGTDTDKAPVADKAADKVKTKSLVKQGPKVETDGASNGGVLGFFGGVFGFGGLLLLAFLRLRKEN